LIEKKRESENDFSEIKDGVKLKRMHKEIMQGKSLPRHFKVGSME